MSAQTSRGIRSKAVHIHDWLGVDAVNLEPVVIPPSFGAAIDAGLLPSERERPVEPEPADDYDGLQAVAASVSPGFSTTQAREDRSHDRVVTDATCSVCGQPHDDAGVCPVREANGELADDRLRAIGGGRTR